VNVHPDIAATVAKIDPKERIEAARVARLIDCAGRPESTHHRASLATWLLRTVTLRRGTTPRKARAPGAPRPPSVSAAS
jgi:hypothetical protein